MKELRSILHYGPDILADEWRQMGQAYEHIFPGNRFTDLPKFDIRNIPKLVIKEEELRRVHIFWTTFQQKQYLRRQNFSHLDMMAVLSLRFKGVMLPKSESPLEILPEKAEALLQQTEHWGGAVYRPLIRINGINRTETVIDTIMVGIMDEQGKPSGLLHYADGTSREIPLGQRPY